MWGAYDFSTRQRQTPNSIQTMVQLLTVNTRVYIYIYIYIIYGSHGKNWQKQRSMTQHTFLNKITIEKNTTCANTLQMQMLCLFFIEYNADKVGAADVLREDTSLSFSYWFYKRNELEFLTLQSSFLFRIPGILSDYWRAMKIKHTSQKKSWSEGHLKGAKSSTFIKIRVDIRRHCYNIISCSLMLS